MIFINHHQVLTLSDLYSNRRVRPIDGDLPSDAQGLAHIYRNGSIHIRLNSDALWVGCIPCISPGVLGGDWLSRSTHSNISIGSSNF